MNRMDTTRRTTRATPTPIARVAQDPGDPPHWSEPAHDLPQRFQVGWIIGTWLIGAVVATAATLLILGAMSPFVDPFKNGSSGVATIVAALSTFIAFIVVIRARLVRVPDDRLLNSLTVSFVHAAVGIVAILAGVAFAQGASGGALGGAAGSLRENLGIVLVAIERSAAAAVLAGLLVPGTLPAQGPTPAGTQTESLPRDRQL